jgi:hypothetical protein
MGKLLHGNFARTAPVVLTKRQFAEHPRIRRSPRWVELQVAKGLPSHMDGSRRMFPLEECLTWLESRKKGAA